MSAYDDYYKRLTTGVMNESSFRNVWDQFDKGLSDRAVNIYNELKVQRQATDNAWSSGKLDKENATWDMALRLAETGVGSVYDIGERQVEKQVEGESGPVNVTTFEKFNKKTGESIDEEYARLRESGPLDTVYNIDFLDGTPVAYTSNKKSDWVSIRDEFIKPALPMMLMAFPGIGQAVGTALTPAGTSSAVAGMVGGAAVGGTMAELTGGKFIKGAVMGATGAGASQFASNIGEMIGLQGKMAEQVGNAILQGARAELAGGEFLKGASLSGLISTVSNTTGYTEKDIKSVISAVKALDDPNVFKLVGAFSNLKNLDYFNQGKADDLLKNIAADADIAGGMVPEFGTNKAYDDFMTSAMTPEARASIESGLTTNITQPTFDKTTTDTDPFKFSPSGAVTGAVIGSQLYKMADSKPKVTLPTGTTGVTTTPVSGDNYANAPVKGFAMRRYKNAAGQERYIPFIGESPQITIPEGFTPVGMNKGGFIQRRS